MKRKTKKQPKRSIRTISLGVIAVYAIIATPLFLGSGKAVERSDVQIGCGDNCHAAAESIDQTYLRQAQRLHERLARQKQNPPSVSAIARALEQREKRDETMLMVQVSDEHSPDSYTWQIDLRRHPTIFRFDHGFLTARFVADVGEITKLLNSGAFDGSQSALIPTLTYEEKKDERTVDRATGSSQVARGGYLYDEEDALRIADAINDDEELVSVTAEKIAASLRLKTKEGVKTLTLLSSGKSNFEKSPVNRELNVHKALEEHVHNSAVKPGETFSFNATLGGPVTLEKGWVLALGLFGGGAAMTPGGGICQVATTVYRAALLAGLPIVSKRNHSLFVSYYEKYGVGVDATIFPGIHDLVFRNDTSDYLVLQAYTDGMDAYVQVFGVDDDRSVSLEGPYFSSTKPRPGSLRPLGYDEIGWVRTIQYADGREESQPFISRYYKGIPRSVTHGHPVETMTDMPIVQNNKEVDDARAIVSPMEDTTRLPARAL